MSCNNTTHETHPTGSIGDSNPVKKKLQSVTLNVESLDHAQLSEIRRQRNRVAASKYRLKSKQKSEKKKKRERELQKQYHAPKSCVKSLKAEVLDLREELLKHGHCGSVPIQVHLANSISMAMTQPHTTSRNTPSPSFPEAG